MPWNNTLTPIVESERSLTQQDYYVTLSGHKIRYREILWVTTRWVGGTLDACRAKKAEYADVADAEVDVQRAAEAGQYQCLIVTKTTGEWSPWQEHIYPT